MQHKRTRGWEDKWTYAMPVVRAWRVDEPILLERIASKTYRPEAGQAIALWSPPLLSEEVDLALKIKVTEVSVFGEPPLPETALKRNPFGEAFRPSRASEPYEGRRAAEAAEQAFKDKAVKQLQSLGESSSAEIGFPQSLSSQRYPAFRGLENESLRRLSRRIIGAPS
jgi:hypothetical protein